MNVYKEIWKDSFFSFLVLLLHIWNFVALLLIWNQKQYSNIEQAFLSKCATKIKQSYLQGVLNIHTCIVLVWLWACAFSCQSTQTHSPFQRSHKCAAKEWKIRGQRSYHQGNHSPQVKAKPKWNNIKSSITLSKNIYSL